MSSDMKERLNKVLPTSDFAKSVLTLMTGTTIAQAIPILISPILTRLFSPEEFGILALYMSVVAILSVVVTGRYELAILLPKKDEDANAIVMLILYISLVLSLIFLGGVFLCKDFIISYFGLGKLSVWVYMFPLSVFLVGWSQAMKYWLNRKAKYKVMATGQVSQTISTSSSNLFLGFTHFISGGLILGGLMGQFVNTYVVSRLFIKERTFKKVPKSKIKLVACRYKNFPKITMFSGMINMSAKELPKTLIGGAFGMGVLGFLSLAQRMLIVPISLISTSMSDVFFKYASEQYKEHKNAIDIYDKTLKRLFLIAIIPMAVLYLIAPFVFAFIFGEKWRVAGEITQLLIPFYLVYFVGAPLNTMFSIAEKQKWEMFWQVLFFSFSVGSIVISQFLGLDMKATILNFSIANSIVFLVGIFLSRKIAKGEL